MGTVLVDSPADGVARLTIANPVKRNALDRGVLDGLVDALSAVDARCVVLTGEGNVFSAGYDIADLSPERLAEEAADLLTHPFEAALAALDAVPVPVVAALGGHAFGGGLELAVACDLRVCAPGARLGMPPARLGVVYSHTGLRRFVDAIGSARTRELFLTARPVNAGEALAWGLVNEVTSDAGERAPSRWRPRSPRSRRCPCAEQARAAGAASAAGPGARGRVARAARRGLPLRRLRRGRARVHREAPPEWRGR